MKTQTFLISFLIFSFSTASLCLADSSPAAVRDIDGNELRTGTDYRVLPVIRGSGGGLVTTTRNGTCPLDVAQAELEVDQGLPVNFTPFDPKKGVIRLGVDLNIKFPYIETICRQSTVWRVDEFDGERVVSTNGVEGNPGLETLSNWFSIATYEDGYKFVFCPTVCNFCRPNCGEVSISIKNGIRRLIVGREEPFKEGKEPNEIKRERGSRLGRITENRETTLSERETTERRRRNRKEKAAVRGKRFPLSCSSSTYIRARIRGKERATNQGNQ